MAESVSVFHFMLIIIKVLFMLVALLLLMVTAGWLRGVDNIALPGLGLILATPVLLMLLAITEVVILLAAMVVSALTK